MSEPQENLPHSTNSFRASVVSVGSDVTDDEQEDSEIILSTENSAEVLSDFEDTFSSSSHSGISGNCPDSTLNSAIWYGRYELVKILLKTGANVNKASEFYGVTPLIQACRCNRTSIVQLLLENSSEVNFRPNAHGATALYWAVKKGNYDCVKMLIDHGAQVRLPRNAHDRNMNLVHVAAKSGKVDIIDVLCANGGDVNEHDDSFGETPLFNAVRANNFEIVERLLELGSSVNTFSFDLATPLHLAAGNVHRNIDILQLLLDNGALVNVKDRRGYIPLMMCLNSSFLNDPATLSLCQCLIRHGSLVNDEHCHQALEWRASHFTCLKLIKLCIVAGLNLYKGNWVSLFSSEASADRNSNERDTDFFGSEIHPGQRQEFITFIQNQLRNPHPLTDCCRVAVRTYLTGIYQGASIYYLIQKLPLPESIVLYLLLEE